MANKRIFYACQAVGISEINRPNARIHLLHGVQSVGINTSFDLEQVFELGQLQIYENIENIPNVEVTLEKVLDGYPLIYTAATSLTNTGFGTAGNTLSQRIDNQCCVHLAIFDESAASIGLANTTQEVYMSGMYVNNVSYTFPVDGSATESITLSSNHKLWGGTQSPSIIGSKGQFPSSNGKGTDSGDVARRENVDLSRSTIPASIIKATEPGRNIYNISLSSGNAIASNIPKVHIQNVTISSDFGREDIFELGRKSFYHRPASFPIEVTCEFEVISNSGDHVDALEDGNGLPDQTIMISTDNGYKFDLGSNNKLTSVNFAGGDAGGGNATMTFSYVNYNDLTIVDGASGLLPAVVPDPPENP